MVFLKFIDFWFLIKSCTQIFDKFFTSLINLPSSCIRLDLRLVRYNYILRQRMPKTSRWLSKFQRFGTIQRNTKRLAFQLKNQGVWQPHPNLTRYRPKIPFTIIQRYKTIHIFSVKLWSYPSWTNRYLYSAGKTKALA